MSCPGVNSFVNDCVEGSRTVRVSEERAEEASDSLCLRAEYEFIVMDLQ